MTGSASGKRLTAGVAILLCGPIGLFAPALVVFCLITAVLVILVAAETRSGIRRRARGLPSPADLLDAGRPALD